MKNRRWAAVLVVLQPKVQRVAVRVLLQRIQRHRLVLGVPWPLDVQLHVLLLPALDHPVVGGLWTIVAARPGYAKDLGFHLYDDALDRSK